MLFNDSLSDDCTDASENKAENEKHPDRLVIDRKEQIVAVFGGISSVKQALAV